MNFELIAKALQDLQEQVDLLRNKRIRQMDIIPDSIKTRAMGEANRYVVTGLEADLPEGYTVTGSTLMYFASDTNKLYIWNGLAWKSVTLS